MTTSILVAIGVMFIPVAMLNFDKGEAKTTGGIVFVAGIITLVGAFFTAVVYKDNLGAALLFSFAILIWLTVVKSRIVPCPTVFQRFFSRLFSRVLAEAEPMLRRLITLIFADWIPPDLASSRSFLSLVA